MIGTSDSRMYYSSMFPQGMPIKMLKGQSWSAPRLGRRGEWNPRESRRRLCMKLQVPCEICVHNEGPHPMLLKDK